MMRQAPGLLTTLFFLAILHMLWTKAVAAPPAPEYDDGVFRFAQGEPKAIAFSGGLHPYLIAALAFEGLAVFDGDGRMSDHFAPEDPLSEITSVAVTAYAAPDGSEQWLVAAADEAVSAVYLLALDPLNGKLAVELPAIPLDPVPSHLCFARDAIDGSLYLYTGGEHGRLTQYRVVPGASTRLRPVRTIEIGGETSACAADASRGVVYAVEPETGLWSIAVDPETDALRRPEAIVAPHGPLDEPVSVTLLEHRGSLTAILADEGRKQIVRIDQPGRSDTRLPYTRVFGASLPDGEVEGMVSGSFVLDGRLQDVIALTVQDGSGGGSIHLVPAGRLGKVIPARAGGGMAEVIVHPRIETDPAPSLGDAADDPAIWIHPDDPAQSLILGTDKNGGLMVMDLDGRLIQFLADGRMNNVDVRAGFANIPGLEHIAAATDRTHGAIALYAIDPATRRLGRVEARTIPAEFYDPYGLCLYRSNRNDSLYVIATSGDGLLHQWRLSTTAGGKVDAERVRRLVIGTVAEGCVADDETGMLYVGEEDVGIWRYGAEPDAGEARELIAGIRPDGELTDDVEGLAIYRMDNGGGYLLASSQGSNSYALYDRKPPHAFRGMFRIRANAESGIDGVSETDGLDVSAAALPGYPDGLLVVQDGRNIEPPMNQNFKFVSWEDIAQALGLP